MKNIKYLIYEMYKERKGLLALLIINTIIVPITPIFELNLQKYVINSLLTQDNINNLIKITVFMLLALLLLKVAVEVIKNEYDKNIIVFRMGLLRKLQEKCLTMKYSLTEDSKVLDKISLAKKAAFNNYHGIEGILRSLFPLFANIISISLYVFITVKFSLLAIIYIIINISIVYLLNIKGKSFEYSFADDLASNDRKAEYFTNTLTDFSYYKDIKLFNLKDILLGKFRISVKENYEINKKINFRYFIINNIDKILLFIREIIILGILCYKYINDSITIGEFYYYFGILNLLSNELNGIFYNIAHIKGQNKLVTEFRLALDIKEDSFNGNREIDKIKTIEFKNVSFKYPYSEKYVLNELSFKINENEKIALVGLNGAGKSTITKLILGLFEITSGEILINDININDLNKEKYLQQLSAVFQDIKIFAFTVGENVALDEEYNEPKINKILESLDIKEKIDTLKNSLNTNMLKALYDDGVELSGGQNQKIGFARALYKDSSFVILDEPTSALDPIAEESLYKNYSDMMKNKTSLFISHRLASTKFCDKIMLLGNGRLLEYGTHYELILAKGEYYNLFNLQTKNYIDSNSEVQNG